jgi:hypothetical protein
LPLGHWQSQSLKNSEDDTVVEVKSNNKKKIRLYFDSDRVCLGGVCNHWWQKDFCGDYWASDYFWLPYGYNPTGKHLSELQQYQSHRE